MKLRGLEKDMDGGYQLVRDNGYRGWSSSDCVTAISKPTSLTHLAKPNTKLICPREYA